MAYSILLLHVFTSYASFLVDEPLISYAAETEVFRSELAGVRNKLEPWEKQMIECRGKLDVASAEKKLLIEKVMFLVQTLPRLVAVIELFSFSFFISFKKISIQAFFTITLSSIMHPYYSMKLVVLLMKMHRSRLKKLKQELRRGLQT